ncbi:SDR family NAD(P)-dependent oxidoreductase [Actinocorallia aurantiaca]|uniref:SDR family NAD(P)-dependent oxidoreductase n=1 Tax=Actinocorallia aurantiaca TaxID=46204 RepID=A0ABN3UEU7_9ACTN
MNIVVIGAGPGLGMGVARAFGRRGFAVGLVARDPGGLRARHAELAALGVKAATAPADVRDPAALRAALDRLEDELGPADVVEYGPDPRGGPVLSAAATTPDAATAQVELLYLGALVAAERVLPAMTARGDGGLLLTTGASGVVPMPVLGSAGPAMAALRNWALAAHAQLAPAGVYVGTVTVATAVQPGTEGDPDRIGDLYHDMWTRRDRAEETVGDLDALRARFGTGRLGPS